MTVVCYILFSEKLNKFYVGATHDEIEFRLQKHNKHSYGAHRFTAGTNDWGIYLILEAVDFPHAVRMERKIKAMKSRTYILNLKKYPELQEKLKNQRAPDSSDGYRNRGSLVHPDSYRGRWAHFGG